MQVLLELMMNGQRIEMQEKYVIDWTGNMSRVSIVKMDM